MKHRGYNDGPPTYDFVACWPDCEACLIEKLQKKLKETELQVSEQKAKYSDLLQSHHSLCYKVMEAHEALKIAKAGTIHVLSGHVYGTDGRLVEFVDGCARCRIERILGQDSVRRIQEPAVHECEWICNPGGLTHCKTCFRSR